MCRLCADIKKYAGFVQTSKNIRVRSHLFHTIVWQQILDCSNRTLQVCCLPSHKVHVQVMNVLHRKKPPYRIPLQALTTETLTAEDTIEAITATIST